MRGAFAIRAVDRFARGRAPDPVSHSLRPRGSKVRTTALFIWERVLKERPLATRLGWLLRKNLLLILQLLAAIALIAALADPSLIHFGAPAGDTVVVMDLTASMKAKGPGGTRFDAARRELLSLVDALARRATE